jgi:hypothetical protein
VSPALPARQQLRRSPGDVASLEPLHCRHLAAALALLATAASTHAEIITEAELINGRTMTQAQCAAVDAVWITAMGRPFCMRYFLSTAGGEGKRPVGFLNGDAGKIIHEQIATDLADLVAKALARQLAADKAKAEKASADAKPQAAPAPNGAPAGLPALAPTPAPILQGINLRGADYSNFSIALAEPGLCQNACRADTKCAAWTYVQPGAQGEQARCWLKNRVPPRSQGNCCVSGVERGEESAAKKD